MRGERRLFLFVAAILLCWNAAWPSHVVPVAGSTVLIEEKKYVALTFDDGPWAETTSRLLDGLRERDVNATFFLIGEQIEDHAALVRRMRDEGHQVGNHSWSHVKLQGASAATVTKEVGRTDALLRRVLGEDTYWVRPPYGLLDEGQKELFTVPLVHWSVDPEDWRLKNADADVAAVLRQVQPGDIVLMHDSLAASVDAALRIVDTLEAQGYTFVTVKELLILYGVTPQSGVMYRSAHEGT